jgi:hypothetical protein
MKGDLFPFPPPREWQDTRAPLRLPPAPPPLEETATWSGGLLRGQPVIFGVISVTQLWPLFVFSLVALSRPLPIGVPLVVATMLWHPLTDRLAMRILRARVDAGKWVPASSFRRHPELSET